MSVPNLNNRLESPSYLAFEINTPVFMFDDFTNLWINPLGRMATSIALSGVQRPEVHVTRFDTRLSGDERDVSFDALLLGHARPFPSNTTCPLYLPDRSPIVPIAFEVHNNSVEAKVIEIRPSLRDPLFDSLASV